MSNSGPPNIPVFDELGRDFFQETRRPLKHVAITGVEAHMRIGEVKFVFRPRDRDVKEAPFLFDRVARFELARAGKHTVGQPDDEYGVKFKAFGLMHRR